jgi:hypothetical protein
MKAPNLNEATAQVIFDFITKELLKQNERSADSFGLCLYRRFKNDGTVLKCAIGQVIPDEKYKPAFEHRMLVKDVILNTLGQDLYMKRPRIYDLLRRLQDIHDNCGVSQWHVGFDRVAKEYELQFT